MESLPPDMIAYYTQVIENQKKNRNRKWNRDEEMRKAEEEMYIQQLPDGNYRINLENSRGNVDYCTMDYIRKLIYDVNYLKYRSEQDNYEIDDLINRKDAAERRVEKLKSICMDLYNRIPPNLRPPPPF